MLLCERTDEAMHGGVGCFDRIEPVDGLGTPRYRCETNRPGRKSGDQHGLGETESDQHAS